MAVSDVLLINLWEKDVGRHNASGYAILKVIFEVNLKLFDPKSRKKLLFVFRDYELGVGNIEQLKLDVL